MSTPGAAVDLMVVACFKAAVILRLNVMSIILLIDELVKTIAQVATSLKTRICAGLYVYLALILQ